MSGLYSRYFGVLLLLSFTLMFDSNNASAQGDSVVHFRLGKIDSTHWVTIARRSKGAMKAKTITDAGELDMLSCSSCTIKSFKLVFYYKYFGETDTLGPPGPLSSNSNKLTPQMKKLISRAGKDNGVYSVILTFTDIEYEDPDNGTGRAPDIKLTIMGSH